MKVEVKRLRLRLIKILAIIERVLWKNRNMKRRKGKIIPNGVILEPHEYETVTFLTEQGFNIELIKPTHTPKMKNPDIMMNGLIWEMKCPQGKSWKTVEQNFKAATKQSGNIVFDLRKYKGKEDEAIRCLKRRFHQTSKCRKLKIITKSQEILDFLKRK